MTDPLVTIAEFDTALAAHVLRTALAAAGIDALLVDEYSRNSEIQVPTKVRVPREQEEAARRVIARADVAGK